MFHFSGCALLTVYSKESMRFTHWGFPIRKFPDHRLLHTSPRHIAVTPRPSSLFDVEASTIRPYPNIHIMYTWFADHPDADILLHSNANKSAVILYSVEVKNCTSTGSV